VSVKSAVKDLILRYGVRPFKKLDIVRDVVVVKIIAILVIAVTTSQINVAIYNG
jgi:hypothetical protein